MISKIHHTSEYKQYCHVGNTAKQCRLGLFQDSDFAGDLDDSKSTSGGTLCIFGSHTFVPISWMCKKQTSVSHSSTESEILSLDTGLRLDGLPALELWDLIVSVLGNASHVSDGTGRPVNGKNKFHNKIDVIQDIDSVPSFVQSASREALLSVFEDNEAVIKMIMKGRSPTMRHVSRTHRVALDWLFDRINLDPKIQIKYIDTKNQLADILTKGNFTRYEWNHLLTLFNISHFSSTLGRTAHSARNEETIHDRTGKPASENIQGKANFEKFIVGSETTEFVNKVRNQVRIRQKRNVNKCRGLYRAFDSLGNVYGYDIECSHIHGKELLNDAECCAERREYHIETDVLISLHKRSTMKKKFIVWTKLCNQRNSWTQLSLINDPVIISLQSTKVYVFSDSVLCLGKVLQHPECNEAWKSRVAGVRAERNYRDFEIVSGESTEFEWNIFPGFTSLQLCDKISDLPSSLGKSPETFTGRILFMSMFNDISCEKKGNKEECLKYAEFVATFARRFGIGQWSFIGPSSEKKWYPSENSPQGEWDHIAEEMLLKFAESGHPIFRATTPLSRGKLKSKGKGKVSFHFTADTDTVDTIYRIILSVNQLSIYGAVAAICDEYDDQPDSMGEPVILEGQSIVLGKIKAEVPVQDKGIEDAKILMQNYFQQVNSLSSEDRLDKFCKEAGFMSVVEVGQYFVTRNISEFVQCDSTS